MIRLGKNELLSLDNSYCFESEVVSVFKANIEDIEINSEYEYNFIERFLSVFICYSDIDFEIPKGSKKQIVRDLLNFYRSREEETDERELIEKISNFDDKFFQDIDNMIKNNILTEGSICRLIKNALILQSIKSNDSKMTWDSRRI